MTPAPHRVLVAENQYLIAMEVERILLEALHCNVTIAPLSQLADALRASSFDVVIVDAVLAETMNIERTRLIIESGAHPVFLSSYDFTGSSTIISGHPVVTKPPQAEELAAAVLKAAHARAPSDRESFLDDR